MKIREATIWDLPEIVNLWDKAVKEVNMPGKVSDLEQQERFYIQSLARIKSGTSFILVLDINGVKGFISVNIYRYEIGSNNIVAHGDCIYISNDFRNNGYDKEMIEAATELAKYRAGINEILLETVYNPTLAKVWERKGFIPYNIIYRKEI